MNTLRWASATPPAPVSPTRALLLLLAVFAAWTAWVAFGHVPEGEASPGSRLAGEIARVLIFGAPVLATLLLVRWPDATTLGLIGFKPRAVAVCVAVSFGYAAIAGPLTWWSAGAPRIEGGVPLWSALTLAIVLEELLFRGWLVPVLARLGHWPAIMISAGLFAAIHFPGWWLLDMVPSVAAGITATLSIFGLGVLLGWLFLHTRCLWGCILLHAVNNGIAHLVAS